MSVLRGAELPLPVRCQDDLALRAPALAIGAAAVPAGFAFSYGTVVFDTSLQALIPRDKLSRVSAYNWMGAMIFLPAGYAIAGPVADRIGISTSLWIGAAWIVVTTIAVISVPSVRNFSSAASQGAVASRRQSEVDVDQPVRQQL